MSDSFLPKELRESLRKTGQFVSRAILLSTHKVEGTAVFDQNGGLPGVRGDFFPTRTNLVLSENQSYQLHLEKSNITLNVRMSPCPSATGVEEHFRFELVTWEAFALPTEPHKLDATWKPAGPATTPLRHEW